MTKTVSYSNTTKNVGQFLPKIEEPLPEAKKKVELDPNRVLVKPSGFLEECLK
jgi:hypothetical protein